MNLENTFELFADGYKQKEIADKIGISLSSLEKYIKAEKKEIGAKTIIQLAIKKNNTMESIVMHKIINFIINNNIDIIKEIYSDKVPDYMLSHLIDKKNEYKEFREDNTKAWMDFIGNLDGENSEILFNFINSKK